jgi:hypothetical protein
MSQFYDLASLVVIPSGYKASTIYAQKPLTTGGQLSFTRASGATRVGPNGLIEEVRTNLVLQSEAFNTTWVASRGSVTANATTAPNGTTTADKFVADTQLNPHFVSQSISGLTSGGIYTSSVYAKAAEWNSIAIFRGDSAIGVSFRLDTQATTILAGTPTTFSITSVGNGWFRCSVSFAIASTSDGAQVRVGNDGAYSIVGNNVNGVFLWGAQYEVSDFGATNYIPTTTAAVSVGPVSNVPRLDYLGSSCPRLLLEPQRTNLTNFSEQFDNAYWNKLGTSILANNTTAPDGYVSADRLTSSGAGSDQYIERTGFTTTAGTYTSSIFVKNVNATATLLMAVHIGEGSVTSDMRYTWSTNTFTLTGTNAVAGKVTNYGDGWVRLEFTYTIGASVTQHRFRTYVQIGVSTNSIFIWGAQLEAGAYATSYIPTLGASVTRVADAASKTGISSLIGQTEGTMFLDFSFDTLSAMGGSGSVFAYIEGVSADAYIIIFPNGTVRAIMTGGCSIASSAGYLTQGGRYKMAFAYKQNDFAFYVNGVQIGTDTSGTVPACSTFGLQYGSSGFVSLQRTNQALLFKTRLTNAQLSELTTL